MIERITKNENRLIRVKESVENLQIALNSFKLQKNDLRLLNNYYGSKNWFNDKEAFEKGKITNIKAGVLSEDAVWNVLEDINDLIKDMEKIVKEYKK